MHEASDSVVASAIDPLMPQSIAGIFGREKSVSSRFLPNHSAKFRIFSYSIPVFALILVAASIDGVMLGPNYVLAAFGFSTGSYKGQATVYLPLLLDPVAIVLIVTILMTPVCCAQQVRGIKNLNSMIESNIGYRMQGINVPAVNKQVAKANHRFDLVGRRTSSLVFFAVSLLISINFYGYISRDGVLESWNPTHLSNSRWQRLVFRGWWANSNSHLLFAVLLVCGACYYLYFLLKQLFMGAIFAVYGRAALHLEFGASPNLHVNTDGYHGLRSLRHFMQWTYVATFLGYILTISVFTVWLPFDQVAVYLIGLVVGLNVLTVLYPSSIAVSGNIQGKRYFVAHLVDSADRGSDELHTKIERAWSIPILPFRIRSTVTAVILYLLFPALLLLVSAKLKG